MHHAAWVIPPFVLVGVLAFSATTKLGKGELLRKIIRNLRLSDRILPVPLARAIPAIEFALVAGMLAPWLPVFRGAAAATLVLMVTYWALIARGLTITPRPACGCFGDVDQPISRRTLVRNTLLVAAAAATLALAGSGRTVWTLLSDAEVGDWLWLAFAAVASAITTLVFGSRAEDPAPSSWAEPSHEPPTEPGAADDDYVRTATPELLLHDPESGPVTLLELSAKRAQLLVFVNCYCESTREVIADIESWQARLALVDVRMVFSVPIVARLVPTTPPKTLVDHRGLVWRALGLTGSPNALLLGADGHLAGGPVSGPDEVRAFIDDIEDSLREAPVANDEQGGSSADLSQTEGQLTGDR